MTTTSVMPVEYSKLLGEIKERIRSAQYEALKAVEEDRDEKSGFTVESAKAGLRSAVT